MILCTCSKDVQYHMSSTDINRGLPNNMWSSSEKEIFACGNLNGTLHRYPQLITKLSLHLQQTLCHKTYNIQLETPNKCIWFLLKAAKNTLIWHVKWLLKLQYTESLAITTKAVMSLLLAPPNTCCVPDGVIYDKTHYMYLLCILQMISY